RLRYARLGRCLSTGLFWPRVGFFRRVVCLEVKADHAPEKASCGPRRWAGRSARAARNMSEDRPARSGFGDQVEGWRSDWRVAIRLAVWSSGWSFGNQVVNLAPRSPGDLSQRP